MLLLEKGSMLVGVWEVVGVVGERVGRFGSNG